jgi:hypothetical protein
MRLSAVGLLIASAGAGPLLAQEEPPVRILRGELIRWDVRGLAGELSLRDALHRMQRCRITPDTYMTRQTLRVTPVGIKPGDFLEIVADLREGIEACRALTIYVRASDPSMRHVRAPLSIPPQRIIMDNLWPRGSLTFAGVIQQLTPTRMVVQTRKNGEKTFNLRPDTVYTAKGLLVEAGKLEVHMRVFVRAGNGVEGEMEAYQVLWGDIVTPKQNSY